MPEERSTASGLLWNLVDSVGTLLLSFGSVVVVTRHLGASDYGRYSYVIWLGASGAVLASMGLARPVARFSALYSRMPGDAGLNDLIRHALALALLGGMGTGVLIKVFGASQPPLAEPSTRLLAAMVVLAASVQSVATAGLQGSMRFQSLARANLLAGTVLFTGSSLVALTRQGLTAQLLILLASNITSTALQARAILRLGSPSGSPPRVQRPLFGRAFLRYWRAAIAIGALELIIWQRVEVFFLGRYSAADQVGLYSAAAAISGRLIALPMLALPVLQARVGGMAYESEASAMRQLYTDTTRWLLLSSAPLLMIPAALADKALALLLGPSFEEAAPTLAVLLVGGLLAAASGPGSAVMYGTDRLGFVVRWGLLAAVVTLTANRLLVPTLGALGAAVANVLGQNVALVATLYLSLRPTAFHFPAGASVRAAASGVVAAAVARLIACWIPSSVGLMIAGAVGLAAYSLALLASNSLTQRDRSVAVYLFRRLVRWSAPDRSRER